jgi:hypothetical protein
MEKDMTDLNLTTDIITDSNHHMRRFFRCWIDGSYNGEGHYHNNCDVARENYANDKRLRSHVISEWCDYMAADNDCSTSTVQRHMVKHFTGGQLDALNVELIDDLRDLVRDEMECEE